MLLAYRCKTRESLSAITLVVFAVNLLGDALRDVLDPRLRGRI